MAGEAQTIRRLVAAAQRSHAVSKATLRVAHAAANAARAAALALVARGKLEAVARVARQARDAIGPSWDRDLAALKRAAHAAADEGAPHLHAALFGRLSRAAGRAAKKRLPRRAAS